MPGDRTGHGRAFYAGDHLDLASESPDYWDYRNHFPLTDISISPGGFSPGYANQRSARDHHP